MRVNCLEEFRMKKKEIFGLVAMWAAFLGMAYHEGQATGLMVVGIMPFLAITFFVGVGIGGRR